MDEGSYEARKSAPKDRVEVTTRTERRLRWIAEEKLRIVRETLRPGAVAQVVADQHGIGTGLLYTWRKRMLKAAMTGFAAVEVAPEPETPPLLAAPIAAAEPADAPTMDGKRKWLSTVDAVFELTWNSVMLELFCLSGWHRPQRCVRPPLAKSLGSSRAEARRAGCWRDLAPGGRAPR